MPARIRSRILQSFKVALNLLLPAWSPVQACNINNLNVRPRSDNRIKARAMQRGGSPPACLTRRNPPACLLPLLPLPSFPREKRERGGERRSETISVAVVVGVSRAVVSGVPRSFARTAWRTVPSLQRGTHHRDRGETRREERRNRLYVRWLSTPVIKYGALGRGSPHPPPLLSQYASASAFKDGARVLGCLPPPPPRLPSAVLSLLVLP